MALGAPDNRLNAGDQLASVKRLGEVVIGAEAQALDLLIRRREAGEDQDGSCDLGSA